MFTIYMHIICTYELFYNLVFVENDQFYGLKCNFCNEYWRRIFFIWPIWSSRSLYETYSICKTSCVVGELILKQNETVSISVTSSSHAVYPSHSIDSKITNLFSELIVATRSRPSHCIVRLEYSLVQTQCIVQDRLDWEQKRRVVMLDKWSDIQAFATLFPLFMPLHSVIINSPIA